jgi:hypothetical protein
MIANFTSVTSASMSGFALNGLGMDIRGANSLFPAGSITGSAKDEATKPDAVSIPCSANIVSSDGPVFMPFNITGSAEDGESDEYDDTVGEAACDFKEPAMGNGDRTFTESDIRHDPDYVSLAPKMSKVTFEEVRQKNQEADVFAELKGKPDLTADIVGITEDFVKQMDTSMIWQLARAMDEDVTAKILYPLLHESFMRDLRAKRNLQTRELRKLMSAVLEVLVSFFQVVYDSSDGSSPLSGHSSLASRIVNKIHFHVTETLGHERGIHNRKMIKLAWDYLDERRLQFVNPTRGKEEDVELSLSQKVEVFMNAVMERNACGAMFEACSIDNRNMIRFQTVDFWTLIQVRPGDRQRVRDLFEMYPEYTPSELLETFDKCVEARKDAINAAGTRRIWFHASKGATLSYFCRNYAAIVGEVTSDKWNLETSNHAYVM